VSSATIALCVASLRVFIVVYFVMDSVRKLLSTPSYLSKMCDGKKVNIVLRVNGERFA